MALVGGGGAGNVASSNPAGTGSSLNYIGEHAYAASGSIGVDNNLKDLCDFSTGPSYIVGKVMFGEGATSGDDYRYTIQFDSQVVDQFNVNGGTQAPDRNARPLLLPPYTRVQFQAQNITDTSEGNQTAFFVGRVYA